MGKMQEYIVVSGFTFSDNNRGTSALSYGAISFLCQHGILKENQIVLNVGFGYSLRLLWSPLVLTEKVQIENKVWIHKKIILSFVEQQIIKHIPFFIPITRIARIIKNAGIVAAINGGDGFSDIYGARTFDSRLPESIVSVKLNIPLIFLPQTIGPFKSSKELVRGLNILKHAQSVYLRDEKFVDVLKDNGINFYLAKDLSFYMRPEPVEIIVPPKSIGLNISGLCYYNNYGSLAGRFTYYANLIDTLIRRFSELGCHVFLIPHSYNYKHSENNNDDLQASKDVYSKLDCKLNVTLIDGDLTPPQLKYIISRMSFFIGTRMHSNFAAIFTNTPLYGLSYSYKFEGAFKFNNIPLTNLSNVLDLRKSDIDKTVDNIIDAYYRLS